MNITPTMKGSLMAGAVFWSLIWCAIAKLDQPLAALHLSRWINSTNIFRWVARNRSSTLLTTELVNYGAHGATPEGVMFALGGTLVNLFVVMLLAPLADLRVRSPAKGVKY